MSLNLQSLFAGQGLAQLAGNSVGNLGLKDSSIDIGAPMRGTAMGILAALELQQKQEEEQNKIFVQQLKNSGNLDNTQLKGYLDTQKEIISQKYQDRRAQITASIQQQNADQLGQHYQNQDLMAQKQFGLDTAYKSADLGIKQQNANQLGGYYKGQLEIGKQNADINQQNASRQLLELSLQQDDKELQKQGALGAVLAQVQDIKDPAQRELQTRSVLDYMKKMGANEEDIIKLQNASPEERKLNAVMMMQLSQGALGAKEKAKSQGLTFKAGDNGLQLVPAEADKEDSFTANLHKSQGQAVVDADKQLLDLQNVGRDIQAVKDELAKTPDAYLGPVAGFFTKYASPQVQVLKGTMNSLVLTLKNQLQLGSQGFTEGDRKFLQEVPGDITQYKGSIQQLLQNMDRANKNAQVSQWTLQDKYMKQAPDYEQWRATNPAPTIYIKAPNGDVKEIGWDMYLEHEDAIKAAGGRRL